MGRGQTRSHEWSRARRERLQPGYVLWDADKLEAMAGRVLAESDQRYELWDDAKLEAMEGRPQAEEESGSRSERRH